MIETAFDDGDMERVVREEMAEAKPDWEAVLRRAFPHFWDDGVVTEEAVLAIGREHMNMLVNWIEQPKEIEFEEYDGRKRKLVWEKGDASVGIQDGYVVEDL